MALPIETAPLFEDISAGTSGATHGAASSCEGQKT